MSSLESVVGRLRWAEGRSSAVRYAQHAVLLAAIWLVAVLIVARAVPLDQVRLDVVFGALAAVAAIGVVWLVSRPSPARLMSAADLSLGLRERLSTAWERRALSGPMDGALQRDALTHAAGSRLAAAFPIKLGRREALIIGLLAVTAIILLLVPNPMDQVLAQRHADRAAQARAAGTIAAVQKKLASSSSPAPVDPQVQKILQDTQGKIAAAPDPRSALQNITPAEQHLLQLSDPGTPARASSATNLAGNLSTTQAGRSTATAINAGPSQGAQALRNLATQLRNLSPQDRAELAKALASAAQQAEDPAMASSMQAASKALASGDLSAAAQSLNDLAGQFDSLQQQMSNDQEIASAINGLEAARQQLASQADRDAGQASQSGATAAGTSAGSSPGAQASGSGNGNGNGNGNNNGNGNGNGSGNGNGNGNGAGGNGNGSGGTGGVGASGSGAGSGSSAQSTERVYVPGQPLPGQSESDPTPLGPGQDVPLTPYTQVIQEYQQAALQVTDQTLIPGSERDLIREYFSSLGETGS